MLAFARSVMKTAQGLVTMGRGGGAWEAGWVAAAVVEQRRAKIAAVPEGQGKASRQRSRRRLHDGRDVGSRRTERGTKCHEGGCHAKGSQ